MFKNNSTRINLFHLCWEAPFSNTGRVRLRNAKDIADAARGNSEPCENATDGTIAGCDHWISSCNNKENQR